MRPVKKATTTTSRESDDPVGDRAEFIILFCKMMNLPLDRYETFKDSISPEMFCKLVDRLSANEQLQKLLLGTM